MSSDARARQISRPASRPDADLACDLELAIPIQQEGIRERLSRATMSRRPIENGTEVTFRADAWDAVLRYIEVESTCCPFLDLNARRADDRVVLTVTGRPEARELIERIFTTGSATDTTRPQ